MKLNRHLMKLNLTNQKTKERLILDMVVLSERRILRYLNLKNWVHQKIDTHCSMTNFKAAHKFIHTFKTIPFTFPPFTRSTAGDFELYLCLLVLTNYRIH